MNRLLISQISIKCQVYNAVVFSNTQINIQRTPAILKTTLLFCQPLPFMGNLNPFSWENEKIKKSPSPNQQKIPHFRLNTFFLSIFTVATCICFYYPVALTN